VINQGDDSLPRLIGIGGASGSGKDVVASYLVEHHGYTRLGFADALKQEVIKKFRGTLIVHLFDVGWIYPSDPPDTVQQALQEIVWRHRTPLVRCLLQEMGTNVRRADDPGYWVTRWSRQWHQIKASVRVVVPDVRFENECSVIREQGGILIRAVRPAHCEPELIHTHVSEHLATSDGMWDLTLHNTGTLKEFQALIAVELLSKMKVSAGIPKE